MNNGYNLNSPAVQHDFNDLMKTNPDIYTVVDWLKENVNADNLIDVNEDDFEILFDLETINKYCKNWASKNGYYENISDFSEYQKESWTEENEYTKATHDIQNLLHDDSNLNLTFVDGMWVIWNIYEHKDVFSGETIEDLEKEVSEHFKKIEEDKKRSWELALKAREERAKIAAENASKKQGHRGRPKGSRNRK